MEPDYVQNQNNTESHMTEFVDENDLEVAQLIGKISSTFLVILMSVPFVGLAFATITTGSSEVRQYAGLWVLLLFVYNAPGVIIAGSIYLFANRLLRNQKLTSAVILYVISIVFIIGWVSIWFVIGYFNIRF